MALEDKLSGSESILMQTPTPGKNGNVVEDAERDEREGQSTKAADRTMPCPVCCSPMPDLKGGKASICPVCGYKDSCCY
jgi:hypothetical protein